MKKSFLILGLLITAFALDAQYWVNPEINAGQNPQNLNPGEEGTWSTLQNEGWSRILANHQNARWSQKQTLPFPFVFDGDTVRRYRAASIGMFSFDTVSNSLPAILDTLPFTGVPNKTVMLHGLNLKGSNDNIITKVFGTAPNRQFWVMWSSASAPGMDWTYWSVVLEETTNRIYIVDQRSYSSIDTNVTLTCGIKLNDSVTIAPWPDGRFKVSSFNTATGGFLSDASDNSYYEFIPGFAPLNDVRAKEYTGAMAVGKLDSLRFRGIFRRMGLAPVDSLQLGYSVNGSTPQTAWVESSGLGMFEDSVLQHPTAWVPQDTGVYTVKFWSAMPNNIPDENPEDDTLTFEIAVYGKVAQRRLLVENFTSSACGPCAESNDTLRARLEAANDNIVHLSYPQDIPLGGDPYFTFENGMRRAFYNLNALPWVYFDGASYGNARFLTARTLHEEQRKPAFVELQMFFRRDTTHFTVEVEATSFIAQSDSLILHVALIETETQNNTGANGETVFYNVMKKMLPNGNGTELGRMSQDSTFRFLLDYRFPGNYRLPANASQGIDVNSEHSVEDFEKIKAVAWVQNPKTGEVLNATNVFYFMSAPAFKMPELYATAYPVPAQDVLNVHIPQPQGDVSLTLISMDGKTALAARHSAQAKTPHNSHFKHSPLARRCLSASFKRWKEF